ncbi:MAG: hypothetical protein V1837_00825 [Candidatus Woesearchaeota archaeon]
MEEVYRHIKTKLAELALEEDEYFKGKYYIIPKKFTVEKISKQGQEALIFEKGKEYSLSGILMTERHPGMGRVFFFPYSTNIGVVERYIEVKGYGQDGHDMNLFLHGDGDIHFGMFYKNAKKEYDILKKAREAGLRVPLQLLLGKISKQEWFSSAVRAMKSYASIFHDDKNVEQLDSAKYDDIQVLETIINRFEMSKYREDSLSAYRQPYDAGFVVRAPISPFRLGDPSKKYELNNRNKMIARSCGQTFLRLLNIGYLHLCPGTGNWTTMGELTDMSDCYDIKKDKNIKRIVSTIESKVQKNYWEYLLGSDHTANLTNEFIKGIYEEELSLKEAAEEIRRQFFQKTLSK